MDEQGESLDERLKKLDSQLASKKGKANGDGEKETSGRGKGYTTAVKLSSEFIAAIVTGAVLGYLLDYFLGTKPWGMVIFLLIGFAAAILNMLRASGYVETPEPKPRDKKD
ncbi:AtpZ/AtpI family protein [Rhizobium sp. L1K21]|uniref:AtpZ/AtpI family protein n=1 Tax=Rhizobium sp. L1K21 TaxID=2954933 RepID=UPI002092540D|nr:AtpZ/AtpI family protein [Rhizobium sp. L1K21]MCO6186936.1 AtpZ/AtpI family protein [Rhizobium sp. L1K21]